MFYYYWLKECKVLVSNRGENYEIAFSDGGQAQTILSVTTSLPSSCLLFNKLTNQPFRTLLILLPPLDPCGDVRAMVHVPTVPTTDYVITRSLMMLLRVNAKVLWYTIAKIQHGINECYAEQMQLLFLNV